MSVLLISCVALIHNADASAQSEPAAVVRLDDEIDALVEDLRDDDVPFNAEHAKHRLIEIGPPAVPALNLALASDDWQQRQLAAHVLRRIDGVERTVRLLEVTVEGLADDPLPEAEDESGERVTYNNIWNAADGTRYLMRHTAAAAPFIRQGLESDDAQQRFLCAFLCGVGGFANCVDRAAPILVPHLRDNDITGDAVMACAALFQMGEAARPWVERASRSDDDQQARLARLILMDWNSPPRTWIDFEQRKAIQNGVTCVMHDPALRLTRSDDLKILWGDAINAGVPGESR